MKRWIKIVLIVFFGGGCYLIYSMFDKVCRNFNIIDIELKKVNSIKYSNLKRTYYLITFKPEYCNCKEIFMSGVPEPGAHGIVNKIQKITITDSLNNDITYLFKNPFETNDTSHVFSMIDISNNNSRDFFVHSSVDKMVQEINLHKSSGTGLGITDPCLFYLDSGVNAPSEIKIYFTGDSIERKVNNFRQTDSFRIESK